MRSPINENYEERRILVSIDASTKSTGIAVWDNDLLVDHETINAEDLGHMDNRFPYMAGALLSVLTEQQPDIVYIEEAVVVRNAQTQRFLVRLQGVVYGWCLQHNCRFEAIRPTVWRKQLGFKQGRNVSRQDLKAQAVEYVQEQYPDLKDLSEDEYEAICIGVAALKILQDEKEQNHEQ